MTHTYHINGITCNGCVAKAKSALLTLGDITEANVQLAQPQATITMQKHISVATLQAALNKAGNYTISESQNHLPKQTQRAENADFITVYKPILLLFAYVLGISFLTQLSSSLFSWQTVMRHFMAGFFLAFSFFKLLNLKGFADSYAMYDVLAKRWQNWGYVYAFIELGLGIAYTINAAPLLVNMVTFVVMSISIIGVVQSIANKRTIQCACLGAVFNLPMSTITVIEDLLMITMSGVMILMLN